MDYCEFHLYCIHVYSCFGAIGGILVVMAGIMVIAVLMVRNDKVLYIRDQNKVIHCAYMIKTRHDMYAQYLVLICCFSPSILLRPLYQPSPQVSHHLLQLPLLKWNFYNGVTLRWIILSIIERLSSLGAKMLHTCRLVRWKVSFM